MIFMLIVPMALTIVPVMVYQGILLLGKKRSAPAHYAWTYLLMIYIWLVLSVTGIGSIWDIIEKGGMISVLRQANISLIPFQSEGLFTYCMNVLMLMPLGFLLPYLWKNFRNPLKTALTGLLFSVFIEFAQLPTGRLADVDDLMMNTLGTILGYGIWRLAGKYFFPRGEGERTRSLGKAEPVIYLVLACGCNFLLYYWVWFV